MAVPPCSNASQARGEGVIATASRVDRWLLIESEGSWSERSLPESRGLDDRVLLDLQARVKAAHARPLLIRRARTSVSVDGREVYAADSRPGHEFLLRRVVHSDEELAALALPFEGDHSGWTPVDALVCVCTHGKHDVCCAVRGRPVASALSVAYPDITYEVSHIGGDRFAANVVVLPGGHYLGRVTPADAAETVSTVLAGRRPSSYYRGRSVWSGQAQAAQEFAVREYGGDSLDDWHPRGVERLEERRWRTTLAAPDGRDVAVEVEQRLGPEQVRLTCHAQRDNAAPSWQLVAISEVTPSASG